MNNYFNMAEKADIEPCNIVLKIGRKNISIVDEFRKEVSKPGVCRRGRRLFLKRNGSCGGGGNLFVLRPLYFLVGMFLTRTNV